MTITAPTLPAWLTLTDNGNGTATLSGTPTNAELGVHNVVLQVTDLGALSSSQPFTITVTNVNDPPVITSDGGGPTANLNVAENTTAVTTVTSSDVDGGTPSLYHRRRRRCCLVQHQQYVTGCIDICSRPRTSRRLAMPAPTMSMDVTVEVSDGNGGTDTQGHGPSR